LRAVPHDPTRTALAIWSTASSPASRPRYEATDAFYRKAGVDALKEAPAVVARLNELRESALEHAGEDERPTLAT